MKSGTLPFICKPVGPATLEFRVRPAALRVRIPARHPGAMARHRPL